MRKFSNAAELFKGEFQFIISATAIDLFPQPELPEFAFFGRSNVGKSTLLNSLTKQRKLARTSNTPGRTRGINFFQLENILSIIDLPGYGYARISKTEIRHLGNLIHEYLVSRKTLKKVFLLIDARHGPKENDIEIASFLQEFGINFQIIITKSDKIPRKKHKEIIEFTNSAISCNLALTGETIVTSSKENLGYDVIRKEIYNIMNT
jgi:GTP-binding protein